MKYSIVLTDFSNLIYLVILQNINVYNCFLQESLLYYSIMDYSNNIYFYLNLKIKIKR